MYPCLFSTYVSCCDTNKHDWNFDTFHETTATPFLDVPIKHGSSGDSTKVDTKCKTKAVKEPWEVVNCSHGFRKFDVNLWEKMIEPFVDENPNLKAEKLHSLSKDDWESLVDSTQDKVWETQYNKLQVAYFAYVELVSQEEYCNLSVSEMYKNLVADKVSMRTFAPLLPYLEMLPVTTASVERSFSRLKLVRNRLRAVLDEDQLNAFIRIGFETQTDEDAGVAVQTFKKASNFVPATQNIIHRAIQRFYGMRDRRIRVHDSRLAVIDTKEKKCI
eukprot:gene2593-2067_t